MLSDVVSDRFVETIIEFDLTPLVLPEMSMLWDLLSEVVSDKFVEIIVELLVFPLVASEISLL